MEKTRLQGEIHSLTSLRMIAALLVFLHHFYPFASPPSLIYTISRQGNMGVSIFFTLSGFLIALRYTPRFEKHGLSRQFLTDFWIKRFARIYPLYFAIALISYLFDHKSLNWINGIIHLTLTQSYFLTLPVQLIPTAWSLSVEIGFYLLIPLVLITALSMTKRFSLKWQQVIVWIANLALWTVGLLIIGIAIRAVSRSTGLAEWHDYGFMPTAGMVIEWTFLGRFVEFAAGVLAAILISRTNLLNGLYATKHRAIVAVTISAIAVIGILIAFHIMHQTGAQQIEIYLYLYFVVVATLTAILIISLTVSENPLARILRQQPFVYLGHISYALYLMQMTILMNLARIPLLKFINVLPLWLYLLLLYIGANVICAILYETVEKPARQLILNRWTHYQKSRTKVVVSTSPTT